MTTKTEGQHAAEFLISEANGYRSREEETIASGEDLEAGTVLGKITSSGKFVQLDPDASDGSETAAAILYAAVDATGGDKQGTVIERDAEVRQSSLIFPDTASETQALADLLSLGIIAR